MFTQEELLLEAEKRSNQAPDLYKGSVRLYFFARFLVSVFEARNHQIPIQVWNEYRNALDHYMRFLTSENYTTVLTDPEVLPPQIKEMQGHLQRAVLDISKLACHANSEWVEEKLREHEPSVLRLVDNGDYFVEVNQLRAEAEKLFIRAKCEDKFLGESRNHNKQIVEMYLDAVFVFEKTRSLLVAKEADINRAYQTHRGLLSTGANISMGKALLLNVLVGLLFFCIGKYSENSSDVQAGENTPTVIIETASTPVTGSTSVTGATIKPKPQTGH